MNNNIKNIKNKKNVYQILSRKYRPHTFEDMIGHDVMIQTLQNAFETKRIAQAYILTGMRGIGKTTTARILARALNYESKNGKINTPTTIMPNLGIHCQDIIDSRHIDVFEMDAASRTGINDIREIIESIRYKPISSRYKIYIIDEVHMLTIAAFNGLLKTLEEPPSHVKFIFATTEIQKIPITVLSRCQRFDLKRIDANNLKKLFIKIVNKEEIKISNDALSIIAQASEGSVRDGLSILDQVITMCINNINEKDVRNMLGIADKIRMFDLFENLMKGKLLESLIEFKNQYDAGVDPYYILIDLAEINHWITRLKIIPKLEDDFWSKEAHVKGNILAAKLSIQSLTKTWQLLLKGIKEVKNTFKPFAVGEMVLIRLGYSSQLPNPNDILKKIISKKIINSSSNKVIDSEFNADNESKNINIPLNNNLNIKNQDDQFNLNNLEKLIILLSNQRELLLRYEILNNVLIISYKIGKIHLKLLPKANKQILNKLNSLLYEWTGKKWIIIFDDKISNILGITLHQQYLLKFKSKVKKVSEEKLIKYTLEKFKGSIVNKIVDFNYI